MVLGAGTACLTLTGAEGCELFGRVTKLKSLRTPRVSPLRVAKVRLLPPVLAAAIDEGPATATRIRRADARRQHAGRPS